MTLDECIAELRQSIAEERGDSDSILAGITNQFGSSSIGSLLSMMDFEDHQSDYFYPIIHTVESYPDTIGLGALIDNAEVMLACSRLLGIRLIGRICNSDKHYKKLLRVALNRPLPQRQSLASLFAEVMAENADDLKTCMKARDAIEALRKE